MTSRYRKINPQNKENREHNSTNEKLSRKGSIEEQSDFITIPSDYSPDNEARKHSNRDLDESVSLKSDRTDNGKINQNMPLYPSRKKESTNDSESIKSIPQSSNSNIIGLLPLLLALLPAFIGVLGGEPFGIFTTDIVLLFVVGWVLWSLSEGMWTLYKSNLEQTRLDEMMRRGLIKKRIRSHRKHHDNNLERSLTPPEYMKGEAERSFKKHTQENVTEQSESDSQSDSKSPLQSQSQSQPIPYPLSSSALPSQSTAKVSMTAILLLLYLITPLIGGLVLYFARISLSSGTELVNSFNIFLYICLELIRNIKRLSTHAKSTRPRGVISNEQEIVLPSFIQYQREQNQQHQLQLKLTQRKIEQEINAIRLVGRELGYVQRKIGEFDQRLTLNELFLKEELYVLDNIHSESKKSEQLHHTSPVRSKTHHDSNQKAEVHIPSSLKAQGVTSGQTEGLVHIPQLTVPKLILPKTSLDTVPELEDESSITDSEELSERNRKSTNWNGSDSDAAVRESQMSQMQLKHSNIQKYSLPTRPRIRNVKQATSKHSIVKKPSRNPLPRPTIKRQYQSRGTRLVTRLVKFILFPVSFPIKLALRASYMFYIFTTIIAGGISTILFQIYSRHVPENERQHLVIPMKRRRLIPQK